MGERLYKVLFEHNIYEINKDTKNIEVIKV